MGKLAAGVGVGSRADRALVGTPGFGRLASAGEMGRLAWRVMRFSVRPPFSWRSESLVQASWVIRVALLPLAISSAVFSLGMQALWFGGITKTLGTLDRLGGAISAGSMRETQVWITLMIIAGSAGSALCADLGARKIREELDAYTVLGLDVMRSLLAPRVIGLAIATPILGLLALLINHVVAYLGMIALFPAELTPAAVREGYWAFIFAPDLYLFVFKMLVVGAFIGVVACHKGSTAGGGTEGVGRAVNQCVLITFFGAWFVATLLNGIFYTAFPNVLVLRG